MVILLFSNTGSSFQIPGEFFVPSKLNGNETELLQTFFKAISNLLTTNPILSANQRSFVQPALNDLQYVFVKWIM